MTDSLSRKRKLADSFIPCENSCVVCSLEHCLEFLWRKQSDRFAFQAVSEICLDQAVSEIRLDHDK